jgi:hypothetical protein
MAGDMLIMGITDVKINVKTRIRFNGHDYSSLDELPPDARAAYRKAALAGSTTLNRCLDKIVLQRRRQRGRCSVDEDIMRVVENNGHVTLPVSAELSPSGRKIKVALVLLGTLAAVACAVFARTVG